MKNILKILKFKTDFMSLADEFSGEICFKRQPWSKYLTKSEKMKQI